MFNPKSKLSKVVWSVAAAVVVVIAFSKLRGPTVSDFRSWAQQPLSVANRIEQFSVNEEVWVHDQIVVDRLVEGTLKASSDQEFWDLMAAARYSKVKSVHSESLSVLLLRRWRTTEFSAHLYMTIQFLGNMNAAAEMAVAQPLLDSIEYFLRRGGDDSIVLGALLVFARSDESAAMFRQVLDRKPQPKLRTRIVSVIDSYVKGDQLKRKLQLQ